MPQDGKHFLLAQILKALRDLGALFLSVRHFHASQRALYNFLHQLAGLLKLLSVGILDDSFRGRIAHIHCVALIFICHHKVYNHVDYNLTVFIAFGHFDVLLHAGKRRRVIGGDLLNFGEKFFFSLLRHLPMTNSKTECIFIGLLSMILDHTCVIFKTISEFERV